MIRRKGEIPFLRVLPARPTMPFAKANSLSKSEKKQLRGLRREKRSLERSMRRKPWSERLTGILEAYAKSDPDSYG